MPAAAGRTIYAEMTGYGSTADAFRVTDSHPEGRGRHRLHQGRLDDARLDPGGHRLHQRPRHQHQGQRPVETMAIKKVFGERGYKVPVSSSKSMLGHLIARRRGRRIDHLRRGDRQGVLPPTINYETPDPECDLDYIPNEAREKRVDHILSNSFGFGGQNISLVVSRFQVVKPRRLAARRRQHSRRGEPQAASRIPRCL